MAICFQLWNVFRQNFPSDLWIDSAIAVCHNIPHPPNLPPGCSRMGCAEFLCQLSGEFSDLQDAQGCRVSVDGI